MNVNFSEMVRDALELRSARAAIADISMVNFFEYVRGYCMQNSCGKYGTNWMCPPAVGSLDELKAKVSRYKQGLLLQTVSQLEDSFDFEGMNNAKKVHEIIFRDILEKVRQKYGLKDILPLNAGACDICDKCSYINGKECIFPDKAIASIEAYGIDVVNLLSNCKIPYNNGKDTVSYVGLILFNIG